MLTLGFTNHFYTLWSVNTFVRYGAGETVNGVFNGESYLVTKYSYIQNLSMDYEAAKAKIALVAGEQAWEEDLSLRGEHGSFEKTVRQINAMADWQFTFGKLTGKDIRISDDVWQLNRAMKNEPKGRTRVIARRRLIELGELVRYDWVERVFDQKLCDDYWSARGGYSEQDSATHDMFCNDVKRKYATVKHASIMDTKKAEAEISGHFFTDGERVSLKIKRVGGFSFEGSYGTTFIEKYMTEDGRMVKYMGSSRPEISEQEFVEVKATIKHSEYKGILETKLLRIKVKDLVKTQE